MGFGGEEREAGFVGDAELDALEGWGVGHGVGSDGVGCWWAEWIEKVWKVMGPREAVKGGSAIYIIADKEEVGPGGQLASRKIVVQDGNDAECKQERHGQAGVQR